MRRHLSNHVNLQVISAEIMQIHHSKHHQTYVNNLNMVEEKLSDAVAKNDVSSVIGYIHVLMFRLWCSYFFIKISSQAAWST